MNRPRLLALRALGLGDLLTGLPALRALRDGFPAHELVLAAPRALAPLAVVSGAVDSVSDVHGIDAAALAGRLPAGPWDLAVNLHGRGPQSSRELLALGPRRLVAWGCPQAGVDGPVWCWNEHEVARWCRLLSEVGIPADASRIDLRLPVEPTGPVGSVPERLVGATVVHPGAAAPARRWPAAHWGLVAAAEAASGRRVLVTGSSVDAPLVAAVMTAAAGVARRNGVESTQQPGVPATIQPPDQRSRAHEDAYQDAYQDAHGGMAGVDRLVGADVMTLAAHVAVAGRVVCGDTGVAHLATALRRPSVVLFGPTSPARWGPPAERREHVALWAGRTGDPHAERPDPGLLAISVSDVLTALDGLPAAPPPVVTANRPG